MVHRDQTSSPPTPHPEAPAVVWTLIGPIGCGEGKEGKVGGCGIPPPQLRAVGAAGALAARVPALLSPLCAAPHEWEPPALSPTPRSPPSQPRSQCGSSSTQERGVRAPSGTSTRASPAPQCPSWELTALSAALWMPPHRPPSQQPFIGVQGGEGGAELLQQHLGLFGW